MLYCRWLLGTGLGKSGSCFTDDKGIVLTELAIKGGGGVGNSGEVHPKTGCGELPVWGNAGRLAAIWLLLVLKPKDG